MIDEVYSTSAAMNRERGHSAQCSSPFMNMKWWPGPVRRRTTRSESVGIAEIYDGPYTPAATFLVKTGFAACDRVCEQHTRSKCTSNEP